MSRYSPASAGGIETDVFRIDRIDPIYVDAGMSEEFDGSLGAFVVASTTISGTVKETIAPTSVPFYDLTTKVGSVLLQGPTNTSAMIRQPYSMADGEEFVIGMSVPTGQGGKTAGRASFGLTLSDNTGGYTLGTVDHIYWNGGDGKLSHWNGSSEANSAAFGGPGGSLYWKCKRVGTDLFFFWSLTGGEFTWCPLTEIDLGARTPTQLYIWHTMTTLTQTKLVTPLEIRWMRHTASSGFNPSWSW